MRRRGGRLVAVLESLGMPGALLGVLLLVALFAPLLAPYDPVTQLDIVGLNHTPPSVAHPFGTDSYGRDVLSRVLHGARVSLLVGAIAALVAVTLGTLVGVIAGYRGGVVDAVLMRLVDVGLALPRLLVLIAVLALWEAPSATQLALLVGATGWLGMSRIVRAETRSLRERDYVGAARALGASPARVLVRHLGPGLAAPLLVSTVLFTGQAVVLEASLSYLGLGVRPPAASWGNVIQDGAPYIGTAWWVALFPGLAVVLAVATVNGAGEALRARLGGRGRWTPSARALASADGIPPARHPAPAIPPA